MLEEGKKVKSHNQNFFVFQLFYVSFFPEIVQVPREPADFFGMHLCVNEGGASSVRGECRKPAKL